MFVMHWFSFKDLILEQIFYHFKSWREAQSLVLIMYMGNYFPRMNLGLPIPAPMQESEDMTSCAGVQE